MIHIVVLKLQDLEFRMSLVVTTESVTEIPQEEVAGNISNISCTRHVHVFKTKGCDFTFVSTSLCEKCFCTS